MADNNKGSVLNFYASTIQLVLIVLKVFHVEPINGWTWWQVLIPLWIGLAIFVVALLVLGIYAIVTLRKFK